MKNPRRWMIGLGLTAIILFGIYLLLFNLVVPKTSYLTLPQKWWRIPLRQPRAIVHDYLGEPVPRQNRADSTLEEWVSGSKDKKYRLSLYYYSDTVVVNYSIHYHYKNWLVERDYLIDSSIRK